MVTALRNFIIDQAIAGFNADDPNNIHQIVELDNCFVLLIQTGEGLQSTIDNEYCVAVYYKMKGNSGGDYEGVTRCDGTLSACLQQFPYIVMDVLKE